MVTQEKLVIYLHADDLARPSWAVVNVDNSVRQSAYRDSADGLAEIAAEKWVIVVVPMEDVLLTSVTLPNMNRSKLLQALPFALEEQLVADIEDLHFASDTYVADQPLPVAIVTHDKMQQWQALLKAWNISIDELIPAVFAIPYSDNVWHVQIDTLALVRTGSLQGFNCDRHNFPRLLNFALDTAEHRPESLSIRNYSNHAFATVIEGIQTKEEFFPVEQMIADMAQVVVTATTFNLLQGKYAVKKSRLPKMTYLTKIIAYLAAAWVFLLFFNPIVSSFILGSRVNNIEDQIAEIYKRNFPQSSSIVAPKQRMQDKLQKLSAEVGASRLLLLLGYIGQGLSETQNVQIKRFDFQSNQLTLELNAATAENFSAFTDYLTRQGLSVKQQSADLAGARVTATLLIE